MKSNAIAAVIALLLGIVLFASMGAWFLRDDRGKFVSGPSVSNWEAERRKEWERRVGVKLQLEKDSTPTEPVDPRGPGAPGRGFVFPPSADLESAECQRVGGGAVWKPIKLEDARALVDSLSENHRYADGPSSYVRMFMPIWIVRTKWHEGWTITLPLSHFCAFILNPTFHITGVDEGIQPANYRVTGTECNVILLRCVGDNEFPEAEGKSPEQEAPK